MTTKAFTKRETVIRSKAVVSGHERRRAPVVSSSEMHTPRRMPQFIPAGQLYYWTGQWQRDEAESLADLKAGRAQTFDNPQDAIRHLLSDD